MLYFVNDCIVTCDTKEGSELVKVFAACNWNNFNKGSIVRVNSVIPEINYDLQIDSLNDNKVIMHWVAN